MTINLEKSHLLLGLVILLFGCQDIVGVTDISNEEINVLTPAPLAMIEDNVVSFFWDEMENVDQYEIQIAQPDFTNPTVIEVQDFFDNNDLINYTLASGEYAWRLRGINSSYESKWTNGQFTILDGTIPLSEQQVNLLSPADEYSTMDTLIQLQWEELADASLYRVIIIDDANNSVFLEDTTDASELIVAFESGNYTWKVRAESSSELTAYSERTIVIL